MRRISGFIVGFTAILLLGGFSKTPQPDFSHDVAPVLYRHCASCHRPGEVAPFSLLGYKDAASHASLIASVTAAGFMPPWKPAPGFGDFRNDNHLTEEEISTLQRWASAGAPMGDPKEAPAPPHFASDWQLGPPDMVIRMPESFAVPASGGDIYQCMVLPLPIAEDRYVAAVEVKPGNRAIVHHAILYLDNGGRAKAFDDKYPGEGYRCFGGPGFIPSGGLGGWAPGAIPQRLPEGVGRALTKNSDLVLQLHYHPSGRPETDQTSVGIYFTHGPVTKTIYSFALVRRDLSIPAGDAHFASPIDFTLPIAIEATAVTPHMHLLGKEMKVTATLPSGEAKPIIWIRNWDFNWQGTYQFREPVELPAGTKLHVDAVYDNSSSNPRNPFSPPRSVSWGENTTDEMEVAFLQFQTTDPSDRRRIMISLIRQLDLWKYLDGR